MAATAELSLRWLRSASMRCDSTRPVAADVGVGWTVRGRHLPLVTSVSWRTR